MIAYFLRSWTYSSLYLPIENRMATTNTEKTIKVEAFQPEKVIIISGSGGDLYEFNSYYKYPGTEILGRNKLHSKDRLHCIKQSIRSTNHNAAQLDKLNKGMKIASEVKDEIMDDDFLADNEEYSHFILAKNATCSSEQDSSSAPRHCEEYDNDGVNAGFTDYEQEGIFIAESTPSAAVPSLKINRLENSMREVFSCRICPFKTMYFYRLRAHFWTHEAEETLTESICAFEESHAALYETYLLSPSTLEAIDKSLKENLSKSSNYNTDLVCNHCSYKTNEETSLKDHILTHLEDKPFKGKISQVVMIKPEHLESRLTNRHPVKPPVIEVNSFSDASSTREIIADIVEEPTISANDGNMLLNSSCNVVLTEVADSSMAGKASHEMFHATSNDSVDNMAASDRPADKVGANPAIITAVHNGPAKIVNSKLPLADSILPPRTKVKRLSDKLREIKELNEALLRSITVSKSNLLHTPVSDENVPIVDKYFYCDSCSYRTMHKINIGKHMIAHEKHPTACETYPYIGGIGGPVGMLFACSMCPYRAVSNEHLKIHLVRHKKRRLLACNYCTYRSFFEDNLQNHKCNPVNYYCCDTCSYKSRKESYLKRHSIIHAKDKPFACKLCPFRTRHLSSLNSHAIAHSGTQRYCCEQCPFKTSKMYNLTEHMLIHTGGKKYLCDICSYQSIKQSSFKNHLLKHTGEKPHTCHLCYFKTSMKCTLRRHIKNVHKNGRKITKLKLS